MNGLTETIWTSIGRKVLMALTGLGFVGFLVAHLAGNLTIYAGGDAFNSYAAHLQSLGPLLRLAEAALATLALVHVSCGLLLFFENLAARPRRYAVNRRAGGRTVGSATMPYTGVLILGFVVFHLFHFTFADQSHTTIFAIVSAAFASPVYVALYILAMVVVAVHVSHGFWSAFQSLGASHPKYMPALMALSVVLAVAVGVGFGFLPIYVSFAV